MSPALPLLRRARAVLYGWALREWMVVEEVEVVDGLTDSHDLSESLLSNCDVFCMLFFTISRYANPILAQRPCYAASHVSPREYVLKLRVASVT